MRSVRTVLMGLGLLFTAYMAGRGLWWTDPVRSPALVIAALLLYLATTWLCILLPATPAEQDAASGARVRAPRMPLWAALLALLTALVVPTAIVLAVGPQSRAGFATWYIGGIGALMTIVMVRRRPWFAWAGTAALAAGSAIWLGPLTALALGMVGSLMWVTVAHLVVFSLGKAEGDTSRLAGLQQAASAWQASQAGRQRERRVQIQRALAVAGPVLTRVVLTGGVLDDDGRTEARLAEGRLRDELRGPRLLDDDVRAALDAARRRGAAVTVLDEGGLDGVDEQSLAVIRAELAEAVRAASSSRLYIRTAPHDEVAVTVVGRQQADATLSDDDSVDLWREIRFPSQR